MQAVFHFNHKKVGNAAYSVMTTDLLSLTFPTLIVFLKIRKNVGKVEKKHWQEREGGVYCNF